MNTKAFGRLDPLEQRYDCHVQDFDTLMSFTEGSPFSNWIFGSDQLAPSGAALSPTAMAKRRVDPHDFTTWFPRDRDLPCIYGARNDLPLSYADLHLQISACPKYAVAPTAKQTIVAVLLPTCWRAETAVVLCALLGQSNVAVAPLDESMPRSKLIHTLQELGCSGLVTTASSWEAFATTTHKESASNGANDSSVQEAILKILTDVRVVDPAKSSLSPSSSNGKAHKAGSVEWRIIHQSSHEEKAVTARKVTVIESSVGGNEDKVKMLLRTSGTTAGPKLVALTDTHLLHAGSSLAYGLRLRKSDVAINAMPLFHIGGIAGSLLCVLVSGSAVVMMAGPFDPQSFLDRINVEKYGTVDDPSIPTWYYAGVTMHQALLLTGKQAATSIRSKIRLIRSATAHLPHSTAMELARFFDAAVYPTYGMTEAMPICIPNYPVRADVDTQGDQVPRGATVQDSVGSPAAASVAIVDEATGRPLPYGSVGEIAVAGPGVIPSYVGLNPSDTHVRMSHATNDRHESWLLTGDVGQLDNLGNLFIKGRSKEMIKRGGEQVWPNEVDKVILDVPGVQAVVVFGVPNELWGEEVAAAVVPSSTSDKQDSLREFILEACRANLEHFAVPRQIVFVASTASFARGPTGKVLRRKMAEHLNVQAVDVMAMQAFRASRNLRDVQSNLGRVDSGGWMDEHKNCENSCRPSTALNGVRFITACFVVQGHLGFYPSIAWAKMQSFSMNMPVFFNLFAFQLACNVQNEVRSSWSYFVGSKIGSMHALFLVAQLFGIPVWLTWKCGPTGYMIEWEEENCFQSGYFAKQSILYPAHLATGMFGFQAGNVGTTWFQSVVYAWLMVFPGLDEYLRKISPRRLLIGLLISLYASLEWPRFLFKTWRFNLHFHFISWIPALVAATIAGHLFKRRASTRFFQGSILSCGTKFWSIATDLISVILLFLLLREAFFTENCLGIPEDVFFDMRPDGKINDDDEYWWFEGDKGKRVWACDITWDEWKNFIHADESWKGVEGHWYTKLEDGMYSLRWDGPLTLVWLYGLAHGHGLTARLMNTPILQFLSPMSYPVYLLHINVAKYYYLITRGFEAEEWWGIIGSFPIPIGPHEVFLVIVAAVIMGLLVDRCVLPWLVPYTVRYGIRVCQMISRLTGSSDPKGDSIHDCSDSDDADDDDEASVMERVRSLAKSFAGVDVTPSSNLQDLGLDSLGATAFVGTLRARFPSACNLTLAEVANMSTVSDLVRCLTRKGFKDTGDEETGEKEWSLSSWRRTFFGNHADYVRISITENA